MGLEPSCKATKPLQVAHSSPRRDRAGTTAPGRWRRLAMALMLPASSLASGAAAPPEAGDPYLAEAGKRLSAVRQCERPDTAEEIVVCGRRDAPEPYRLPIRPDGFDPQGAVESVSRERHKLIQEGDAGIGSCSTVGPGGYTGCFHRDVRRRCQQEGCGAKF